MMYRHGLLTACIALGLSSCGSNSSDLTARQVWEMWQDMAKSTGQTMTGTEVVEGDTLIIKDLTVAVNIPDVGVDAEDRSPQPGIGYRLEQISLIGQKDGTVRLDFPDELDFAVIDYTGPEAADGTSETVGRLTVQDDDIVISGTADEVAYDVAIGEYSMSIDAGGRDTGAGVFKFTGSQKDLKGSYKTTAGDLFHRESMLESGPLVLDLVAKDPDADMKTRVEFSGLKLEMAQNLPKLADNGDIIDGLRAGLSFKGDYQLGAGKIVLDFAKKSDPDNAVLMQGGWNDMTLMGDISAQAFIYDIVLKGLELSANMQAMPMIKGGLKLSEFNTGLTVPLAVTEEKSDYSMRFGLVDLSMDETLWALFDPMAKLPRDPATLAFQQSGKMRFMTDIFDTKAMNALGHDEYPLEIYTSNIDTLSLKLLGAELDGKGAFTLENTAKSPDGMPRPSGEVNLKLDGANALIDTLIDVGLMPEDAILGVRMGLAMLARPGEGEDQLLSDIVIQPDGDVLINGSPMPF